MNLYIAEIIEAATKDDFRIQVRVLPGMRNIVETQYLPRYPFFFANQTITGKPGDFVWVLASEDCVTGFVLGYVASYTWYDKFEEESVKTDVFEKMSDIYIDLVGRKLPFADLLVTYWDKDCMHFVVKNDGTSVIAFTNGTLHIVRKEEVSITIENTSIFKISKDEIAMKADIIRLNGEVRLGKNPQGKVLVTAGALAKNGTAVASVWA